MMRTIGRSMSQSQRSYHFPHGRDVCTDSQHFSGLGIPKPTHRMSLRLHVEEGFSLRRAGQLYAGQISGGRLHIRETETNVRKTSTIMNLGNKEDQIVWSSAQTRVGLSGFEPPHYPLLFVWPYKSCFTMLYLLILKTGILIPSN